MVLVVCVGTMHDLQDPSFILLYTLRVTKKNIMERGCVAPSYLGGYTKQPHLCPCFMLRLSLCPSWLVSAPRVPGQDAAALLAVTLWVSAALARQEELSRGPFTGVSNPTSAKQRPFVTHSPH